jgi:hypothetical protein
MIEFRETETRLDCPAPGAVSVTLRHGGRHTRLLTSADRLGEVFASGAQSVVFHRSSTGARFVRSARAGFTTRPALGRGYG